MDQAKAMAVMLEKGCTYGAYMDPDRTVITVVADRSQIEKDLARLGLVSVYDTDGNRLD